MSMLQQLFHLVIACWTGTHVHTKLVYEMDLPGRLFL